LFIRVKTLGGGILESSIIAAFRVPIFEKALVDVKICVDTHTAFSSVGYTLLNIELVFAKTVLVVQGEFVFSPTLPRSFDLYTSPLARLFSRLARVLPWIML
jgi:hypothetical protein